MPEVTSTTFPSRLSQLGLLLWKNWLLQCRKKKTALLEIGIPVLFAVLLFLLRKLWTPDVVLNSTHWNAFSVDKLPTDSDVWRPFGSLSRTRRSIGAAQPELWHTPNSDAVQRVMSRVANRLKVNTSGYDTEAELLDAIKRATSRGSVLGAIVFTGTHDPADQLPRRVSYKIRLHSDNDRNDYIDWKTGLMVPEVTSAVPRENYSTYGGDPGYYREGFLALQHAVNLAIVLEKNSTAAVDSLSVEMKRQPFPPYVDDHYLNIIRTILPFFIMLSFMLLAPTISKDIVLEKELKLKEFMNLVGVANWQHWLSWLIKYLVFILISVTFYTVFLFVGAGDSAPSNSDATLVFVFLLLYCLATIFFCFAVAAFFSKATAASNACAILYIMNYSPYFFVNDRYYDMATWMKMAVSLLHNVAMAFGCRHLSTNEGRGAGLTWSNVNTPIIPSDGFTMAHVLLMLVVDCILYASIAWYVDAVKPGTYGQPLPWTFPCKPSFWRGGPHNASGDPKRDQESAGTLDHGARSHLFEANPADERPGIQIRNLQKVFKKDGKKIVAVDGLNLDMLEGQITALLGHNGAGKTTTMFMMTGFLPPTRGTVYINGWDICTSLEAVRGSLGMCPQENVLFPEMTVEEHLRFFGRLKGVSGKVIDGQVKQLMQKLGLDIHAKQLSKALSGGWKRKLCVGIAMIGDSKVLILDEPTSGMDPENRREMWDVLQGQKKGRTMVLSTHFMDEADFLGDRIAIMAQGQAQCCGTSLFLKGKYGVGYHMVIVKAANCAVDVLTSLITSFVPEASLESNVGAELSYLLPKESCHKFEDLFTRLEDEKSQLGIVSFGASVTTMEEVFLKVGASVDHLLAKKLQTGEEAEETVDTEQESPKATTGMLSGEHTKLAKSTGLSKCLHQYQAMLLKKFHTSRRKWVSLLIQIVISLLFTIWACIGQKAAPSVGDAPPLTLSLSPFNGPVVPYVTTNPDLTVSSLGDAYARFARKEGASDVMHVNSKNNYNDNSSMEEYLLNVAKHDFTRYVTEYMIAGSFSAKGDTDQEGSSVLAYFNNEAYHTPAISLAYIGNAILQHFTDARHEIEVTNHPLPRDTKERASDEILTAGFMASITAMCVFFGVVFLVSAFVTFVIRERSVGCKHLQYVSGAHPSIFWAGTTTWDLLLFIIPCTLMIGIFAAFGLDAYSESANAGYTLFIFILFGCAVLPWTYVLSYMFQVPATGHTWISVIHFFSGMLPLLLIPILKLTVSQHTATTVEWICLVVFPTVAFTFGLTDIYWNYSIQKACAGMVPEGQGLTMDHVCSMVGAMNMTHPCCKDFCGDHCQPFQENYFAWESLGVGRYATLMILQCVAYFALLLAFDSGLPRRVKQTVTSFVGRRRDAKSGPTASMAEGIPLTGQVASPEDAEVVEERERIEKTALSELKQTDSLIVKELKKYYGKLLAVEGLSVGVKQGECFGLLGVNGAGKTTTFKMLTGVETLSAGDAWLQGNSVKTDIRKAYQGMGYCPQFDCLLDQMSVKETLLMFGRLRGVREQDLETVVKSHINSLVLEEHADQVAGKLSGGNKRKLSTAIALIGDAPIVFLDEPTTGVDPVARRLIWRALASVRASGRSIILTTHSMEECEALCTRLAIMVNGQFKCLGSTQELKSKFGRGYTVMARLHPGPDLESRTNHLMDMFKGTFPGCVLKDLHQGFVHYHIPSAVQSWAGIFGLMERAKQQYNIEDYSVSQTTLEQVFLAFARAQKEPTISHLSCLAMCGCRGKDADE